MLSKILRSSLMLVLFAGFVSLMLSCNKETPVSSSGKSVKDKSGEPVPTFCVYVTDCDTGYPLSGAYVKISLGDDIVCDGYTGDSGEICFYLPDSFAPNGLTFEVFSQYGGYYDKTKYYVDINAQIPIYIEFCIHILGKK